MGGELALSSSDQPRQPVGDLYPEKRWRPAESGRIRQAIGTQEEVDRANFNDQGLGLFSWHMGGFDHPMIDVGNSERGAELNAHLPATGERLADQNVTPPT